MKNIQSHLKSGAPLLMLEYALDSATDRQTYGLKNAYQSFRTLAEWKSLLERSSFQIEKITPMPHPVFCPSHGYRAYSNGNVVKIGRRLSGLPLAGVFLGRLLRLHARNCISKTRSQNRTDNSPLKLIQAVAR
jgi:hypothetical protein